MSFEPGVSSNLPTHSNLPIAQKPPETQPAAAKTGMVASALGRLSAFAFGPHVKKDTPIEAMRKELAALVGSPELNQWVEKLELNGLLHGLEVNFLHLLINLIKHLKQTNPALNLTTFKKDELIVALVEMCAKEVNGEMGTSSAGNQQDLIAKKMLAIALPNGKNDIILPGYVDSFSAFSHLDLSGWLYSLLSTHLPKILMGFKNKITATSPAHEKNLAALKSFPQGDKLVELGKVMADQLDRILVAPPKNEEGVEQEGELNKLFSGELKKYSEMIMMHILAHTAQGVRGDKKQVLTSILDSVLSDVVKFAQQHNGSIEKEIALYRAEMKKINTKYPNDCPEKRKAAAAARKKIDQVLKPLANQIKTRLGIDEKSLETILPSLQEMFPDSRLMKFTVWATVGSPAYKVSNILGGFLSDFLLESCRDALYPEHLEPECKGRFTDYPEAVKTLDAVVKELLPNLELTLVDKGSLIGKSLLKTLNRMLLGKVQTDAKFFAKPIEELMNSNLMKEVTPFTQDYLKRTLVSLFANLANSYPGNTPEAKVGMISSAIMHILKICREQVQDYDELIRQLGFWKKEKELCEKMAPGPEKEHALSALELKEEELGKLFQPALKEILNQGGWRDPDNILMPAMLKSLFKNAVAENLLPPLLMQIYSDAFALPALTEEEKGRLKHPEKVTTIVEGLMKKGITSIKGTLNEYSFLFASLLNQKLIHSVLDNTEEAVIAGQLKKVFTLDTYNSRKVWNAGEKWVDGVLTLALKRLSLAYQGVDQGDALSNAIMQLRVLVKAQKIDPTLISKYQVYRQRVQEIRDLDEWICKLKDKAAEAETSGAMDASLLGEINQAMLERREKFIDMHLDEYEKLKHDPALDKQMTLVQELTKIKDFRKKVEGLKAEAAEDGLSGYEDDQLVAYVHEYQRLAKEKQEQLKQAISTADESKIEDLQHRLFIEGKMLEQDKLLTYTLSDMSGRKTIDELITALKKREEEKTQELEQTPPLLKQYQEFIDQFRPLGKQLLRDIGFNTPKDLPVPFFMQPVLWQALDETLLPDLLLDFYRFAWVPVEEVGDDAKNLKEMLGTVSRYGTKQLHKMCVEKDSKLPGLIAKALGANGMEGWFKRWLGKIATDKNGVNDQFWSLIPQFLQHRVEFLAVKMGEDSPSDNILQQMATLIFEPLREHFKANASTIESAMLEYDALPEAERETRKPVLAKQLFSKLVAGIFANTGLNQPKAYGVAYMGPTIISSLKTTLEEYCFDFAYNKTKFYREVSESAQAQAMPDPGVRRSSAHTANAFGGMVRDAINKQLNDSQWVAEKTLSALGSTATSQRTKNWLAGAIKETVNGDVIQDYMSDLPELVGAVILKKMIQLSKDKDLPIPPKAGEPLLKTMPANLVIMILNSIEKNRKRLARVANGIYHDNPDISQAKLAKELKPEIERIVKTLFTDLQIDLKDDLPIPFAEEIWENAGKETVVEMFAEIYAGMTKTIRQKQQHMINMDTRFHSKIEAGHKHARLVEAVKGFTGFAMKYLQNMMVFNTPGIDVALEHVDQMLKEYGDTETAGYLEANWEGAKKWLVENNLKEIAKSGAPGVEGTLFPAAKTDIQAIMLKIFDNFTGNIEKIEKKDPETTFNFALKLMGLLTEHLQLAKEITHQQHKSYLYDVDPAQMEKGFADKGKLLPDMQWRKAVHQVEVLEKEVRAFRASGQKDQLAQAELKLKDAKGQAEKLLNRSTCKKLAAYMLQMGGYHGPEDLTEVPAATQNLLWDALNNSLGPDLIAIALGKAFEPAMLSTYLFKLLQTVNEKLEAAAKAPGPQPLETEEVKARQEKCKQLIKSLTALLPDTALTLLTKLDLVNTLAASQVESALRESMKEWTMLNIMEEALVTGSKNLPQSKLPETPAEVKAAEERAKVEAAKTNNDIQQEAAKVARNVRSSIWTMLKNKWDEMQAAIDNWIKRHDVMGIFSGLKAVLDKVCHFIFFDVIGTLVMWIVGIPLNWIWTLYVKRNAEILRKNIAAPAIHQNLALQGLGEFMEAFPTLN